MFSDDYISIELWLYSHNDGGSDDGGGSDGGDGIITLFSIGKIDHTTSSTTCSHRFSVQYHPIYGVNAVGKCSDIV